MPKLSGIAFDLIYKGQVASEGHIDLYDVARGLIGFHRSLALTTHLVLQGEIITQATSLKGARIITQPAEEGSWKITAIIATGMLTLATAPKESVPGHLIYSLYDYVVKESLGFHVDFDKSLGQQIDEARSLNDKLSAITVNKADSLIEKCSTALEDIHRLIVFSETAESATIISHYRGQSSQVGPPFSHLTYEFMRFTERTPDTNKLYGVVSSYNTNTFKGRLFVPERGRPIPFELSPECRTQKVVTLVLRSMMGGANRNRPTEKSLLEVRAFVNTSKQGYVKSLLIVEVLPSSDFVAL